MISTSEDNVKVWKIQDGLAVSTVTIPKTEPYSQEQTPLSAISKDATLVVVHRGKLMFTVYDCSNTASPLQKDIIDLTKEIKANGNPGF